MNGYVAIYRGRRVEVYADSLWEATVAARNELKPPKSERHMVSVILAEKDGKPVTHVADF